MVQVFSFTCFTGTKVQILAKRQSGRSMLEDELSFLVYLLYWYSLLAFLVQNKNTEAALAQLRSMLEDELSVLTEACVKLQVCVCV